jgi:hypothetical protein
MVYRFQPSFAAGQVKGMNITICQKKGVDHGSLSAQREGLVFAQLTGGDKAFGTPPVERAGHQRLLGIIANEDGKDRVASAPDTIPTHHRNTRFSEGSDRT